MAPEPRDSIGARPRSASVKISEREVLEHGRNVLRGKVYPNMDDLPELSIGTVLANVEALYLQEQAEKPRVKNFSSCYSQVGPVLIALNPFKKLPCYSAAWQEAYRNEGLAGRIMSAVESLGPHCYCTIEESYQSLRTNPLQSVVICGESGAGKTVTNKLMLDYLLDVGSTKDRTRTETFSQSTLARWNTLHGSKKAQLEAANVLLEAFGNAKTGRNDNSSRFGKYSQLYFGGVPHTVCGLKVDHYLLERSRVVSVPPGERNYHIVHFLAAEEQASILKRGLMDKKFKYLSGTGGVMRADGLAFEDLHEFDELRIHMGEAGFSGEQQETIYNAIKSVLYLGNVTFVNPDQPSVSNWRIGSQSIAMLDPPCREDFAKACELLGVGTDEMLDALTHKMVKSGIETIKANVDEVEAMAQRDAVAKTVYSRIFDQIVSTLNSRMGDYTEEADQAKIGLLDIFGFEDMPINGFEQLFINLTNEWIQNLFNNVMFQRELETYREEDIDITFDRPDNWKCVELFVLDKPAGIIKLLQDRVLVANSKDGKDLVEHTFNRNLKDNPYYTPGDPSLVRNVARAKQEKWKRPKIDLKYEECFQIKHFAGPVLYTVSEFISKSKDSLAEHLVGMLSESKSSQVQTIFSDDFNGDAPRGKETKTIGQMFRTQLRGLMDTLEKSSTLFVRCIKPNAPMKPGVFDEALVLEQLTCGGVLAALEMRSAGLPDRMIFADFSKSFWVLEQAMHRSSPKRIVAEPRQRCKDVLDVYVGPEDPDPVLFKVGTRRVFMQKGVLPRLRSIVNLFRERCSRLVQRKWRAKKGVQLMERVGQIERQLREVKEHAENLNVGGQNLARIRFKTAQDYMDTVLKKIQDKPEVWANVQEACNAPAGIRLKISVEKALGEVPARLAEDELDRMMNLVEEAQATVAKLIERRTAVEAQLTELVVARKQEANDLLTRVAVIERACTNKGDTLQTKLQEQCELARQAIDSMVRDELPRVMQDVLESTDLSHEKPRVIVPREVSANMVQVVQLVGDAERAGKDLVEQRKRFEFETMQASPELQALHNKRAEAKERLELLEGDSKEAVRDGLTELAKALNEAWKWDAEVDALGASADDAAKFIDAIKRFLEAERETQVAMERIRKLEAEAQAREVQNLQALFGGYKGAKDMLRLATAFSEALQEFSQELSSKEDLPSGLSTVEETATKLIDRIGACQASIENLGLEAMEMDEVGGKSKLVFNYEGPWSAEFFKLLGQDVKPYEAMARVLDETRVTSVMDAVEALNSGVMQDEDSCGFIIGWSQTWGQYFFLFQKDKQDIALAALSDTEVEIAAAEKRNRRTRLKNALSGAMNAIGKEKMQAAVDARQHCLETRLKEAIKSELEGSYKSKAEKEVADVREQAEKEVAEKTDQVRAEAQERLEELQSRFDDIAQQKAKMEATLQDKIRDLATKINVAEVKRGDKGDIPRFYLEVVDVQTECAKLKTGVEKLREHAKSECLDLEEAMAYCDALLNNPETLPGLYELVEVLQRCQKRHCDAEKLTSDLGLQGQNNCLADLRATMGQAAIRCTKICEKNGAVKGNRGLGLEIHAFLVDLQQASKGFMQLENGFDHWVERLDEAVDFLEQAKICCDLREEEFPELSEYARQRSPRRRQDMWTRMVFGIVDRTPASRPRQATEVAVLPVATKRDNDPRMKAMLRPKKRRMSGVGLQSFRVPGKPTPQTLVDIGDQVVLTADRSLKGHVRFAGETMFAAGEWLGVELLTADGKNDGSVNGVRYFECRPGHGLFLRRNALEVPGLQHPGSPRQQGSLLSGATR